MTRLRVGVIGLGAIAQIHHLPAIERSPDRFSLDHVCDLSPSLVEAIGERFSVPRRSTDWRAVCEDDGLDAVLVLTSGSHAPQAALALAHGRHVLAEKPLCYTAREADELEAAACAAGRVLQVGYMKAHEAVMPRARQEVRDLGPLRLVRHAVLHPSETAQQEHLRLLRFADADPGAVAALRTLDDALVREAIGTPPPGLAWLYRELALGSIVHYLAVFRSLLGRLPGRILAAHAWPLPLDDPPAAWGPEDQLPTLAVHADLGGECRLELTWSWLQRFPEYTEQVDVLSPEGAVSLRLPPPYVHHRAASLRVERLEGGLPAARELSGAYDVAFGRELLDFHAAAVDGAPVVSSAAEGREDARWCQALTAAVARSFGQELQGEAAA